MRCMSLCTCVHLYALLFLYFVVCSSLYCYQYEISLLRRASVCFIYLVRVIEIGRYFSWLLLCDRACPVQQPAFFLSRVLLLGLGKLLSIKKKCHCRFVVMCVGFTTNCQNMSRSKSLPPDIHPLLFLHATTYTLALAGTCTSLVFSQ